MQPDTLIPDLSNPQSWNRFSYVQNNPVRFNDPTGHVCSDPEDPTPSCDGSGGSGSGSSGGSGSGSSGGSGGGDSDDDDLAEDLDPTVVVFCGSYASNEQGYTINDPGPECEDQLPAWYWNPWNYNMQYVQYPGSKYQQYQDALKINIAGNTVLVCYSSGAEACLMYAKARIEAGYGVPYLVLMGPTFSAANAPNGSPIRASEWFSYMSYAIANGAGITVVDDGLPQNTLGDRIAARYNAPDGVPGFYQIVSAFPYIHNDSPGLVHKGINNSYTASFLIWGCAQSPLNCSIP